jgi:hypothetical protein
MSRMRRNILFIFTWDKSLFFSSKAAKNDNGIDTSFLDFNLSDHTFNACSQISPHIRRVGEILDRLPIVFCRVAFTDGREEREFEFR